ncbi:hypothetical protein AAHC03_0279 [Spirometra sp. Aus1]
MRIRGGLVGCALYCFLKNDICPLFNPSAPKRILRSVRDNPLPRRITLSYSSKVLKIISDVITVFPAAVLQGYYKIDDPRKLLAVCLAGSRISQPGYLVLGFSDENERRKLVAALNRLRDHQKGTAGNPPPAEPVKEEASEQAAGRRHLPRVSLAQSESSGTPSCLSESGHRGRVLPSSPAKRIVVELQKKLQEDNGPGWDEEEEDEKDETEEHPQSSQARKEVSKTEKRPNSCRVVQPYSKALFKRFSEHGQPLASLHVECDTFIVYKPRIVL